MTGDRVRERYPVGTPLALDPTTFTTELQWPIHFPNKEQP
jgi:hypothetical protein